MGYFNRDLDRKLAGLEETVLLELYSNTREFAQIDRTLYMEANAEDATYSEFRTIVCHIIGGNLSDNTFSMLDWDFITCNWWDRREVPQFPEADRNYNRSLEV